MTRTQNSFFNLITNLGASLLIVALSFITRSVFISTLGRTYLGLEGLFTNILSMLSLAELGFGSAIVFKLYKPIEEKDRRRIQTLMKLYRQVYRIVGVVIVVLGLILIPFLPHLVQDYGTLAERGLNAVVIFLIYLFNSASSYWFFAYKTEFMKATQKSYILNLVSYLLTAGSSICQILALVLTKNFYIYILVQVAFTIIRNLVYALICDRRHPYLKEKVNDRVSRAELKEFFNDCSALLLYRLSNVVIGGSDNIVLSALCGLDAVGLYANYLSISNSLDSLMYSFHRSIQASLGSLYAAGNLEWSRLVFRVVNFFTVWMYGIGAIGLAVLTNEFIAIWPGVGPDYIVTSWVYNGVTIQTPVALLLGLVFYVTGQKYYCASFRNAMGLFQQMKYRPIASVLVNLAFSILLVPYLGMAGCLISTIISALTVNLIVDPIIIHKHALKQPVRGYYLRNLLYKLVIAGSGLLAWRLCVLIPLSGFVGFVVHGLFCVLIPSGMMVLCFFRTKEFRFLWNTALSLLPRRKA